MAEDKKTLADLKDAVVEKAAETTAEVNTTEEAPVEPAKPVIDDKGRAYGTGRRKDAVARVWVFPGTGKIIVNGKTQEDYFKRATQRLIIAQAFETVDSVDRFDVMCTVKGGGLSGQAGAVRHGLARALVNFEPANRPALKKAGMLTRDSRVVERKKYGRRKARRGMQWAKR